MAEGLLAAGCAFVPENKNETIEINHTAEPRDSGYNCHGKFSKALH
jgi:hypothetical protein